MNRGRRYGKAAILVAVFALLLTAVGVIAQDEPAAIPLVVPAAEGARPAEIGRPSDPPAATEVREVVAMSLDESLPEPDTDKPGVVPEPALPGNGLAAPADDKTAAPPGDAPATPAGWETVAYETFEGAWPVSPWKVTDKNGATGGDVYWDDDDYKPYGGYWSAWVANGGAQGLDPQTNYYPNDMRTFAIYGPFDLRGASDAEMSFYYWNQSEEDFDWFNWMASVDGKKFYGNRVSGDSGGWRFVNFDLTAVPTLGNLAGRSAVWVAISFSSDHTVTDDGTFVDEVGIYKNVSSGTCPTITNWKGEYWNNTALSGNPALCRNESNVDFDWGTGSPNGINTEGFSARYTRKVTMAAGRYRFVVGADDGVRLYIDGRRVINQWLDQAYTEYTLTKTMKKGKHDIKIEYYENTGYARVRFYFEKMPGGPNLALNKVSTAWNWVESFTPQKGNDGDPATRWAGNSGMNWWWVDLGSRKTFNQVRINWNAVYATQYFIGYSDAPQCLGTYEGTTYYSGGLGWRTYNIGSHTARCVAIRMDVPVSGASHYSFYEFEVYNVPGAAPDVDGAPAQADLR